MNLICCSCGERAPARRQWWNRDTGYGICPSCFQTWVRKLGMEEAIRCCGVPGVHHTIQKPAKVETVRQEFNEADCGGVFDGNQVISDADPGL